MTLEIAFLLGLVAATALAGGVLFWFRRSSRRERERLEREHDETVEALRSRARDRIRRLERRIAELERTGHVDFAEDLLPALDSVAGAVDRARARDSVDPEFREGLEMAFSQLQTVLAQYDVDPIEPPAGSEFDPDRHRALRAVDTADVEPGSVVTCHRRGYAFDGRILRPAEVEVGVAEDATDAEPAPQEEAESASEETEAGPGDEHDHRPAESDRSRASDTPDSVDSGEAVPEPNLDETAVGERADAGEETHD